MHVNQDIMEESSIAITPWIRKRWVSILVRVTTGLWILGLGINEAMATYQDRLSPWLMWTLAVPKFAGSVPVYLLLGYYVFLPELLGGTPRKVSFLHRYLTFCSISGWLSIPAVIAYVIGGPQYPWVKAEPLTILSAFLCMFLICLICFGAAPILLDPQTGSVLNISVPFSVFQRVQHMTVRCFRIIVSKLTPTVSLSLGSFLVLLSLWLASTIELGLDTATGYQILVGEGEWVSEPVVIARWVYLVALLLALSTFVVLVARRRRPSILSSRPLLLIGTGLSAACAFFLVSAEFFFPVPKEFLLFGSFFSWFPNVALLIIQTALWTVPIVLWLWFALRPPAVQSSPWEALRVSFLILYFTIWLAVCRDAIAALAMKVYGIVAYFFGISFLAWGYGQLLKQQCWKEVGATPVSNSG